MYKAELDRFKKLIKEKDIYSSSQRSLIELAEEFFSRNYQGISNKKKDDIKEEFKRRILKNVVSKSMKSERDEIDNILTQMKTSLEIILDKSVEETMWEKIAGKLGPLNFNLKIFSKK